MNNKTARRFLQSVFLPLFCAMLLGRSTSDAQSLFNYSLTLVPVSIPALPGLHSFAHAQHQGKWLIIGGRKDGLHARQPFNAFPANQNNTDIYVVDAAQAQVWSASVVGLPAALSEQLQSTNMNFCQDGDTLYIVGGYGFSPTAGDHITHPGLISVSVSGLMQAIQTNQPIDGYFKRIQSDTFAVTGGHLKKLNGLFYLVGGHRFDGRYNPMGHATYTQTYTNQIRKFAIDNSGTQLSTYDHSSITDPVHLRRRDYNLLPQIFPDGEEGFTISSGVFQIGADLPFLYPVDIRENGYTPVTGFNQYLSNYHSAVACLYDSSGNNMHSLFFGGMSRYYYQNGNLIQDDKVPFVKTISRLTRDQAGNLSEHQLPVEMPALQGSSAEFIPNLDLPHYDSKIFKLNQIQQNQFKIGHIFGGIRSTSLNPFSDNATNLTQADAAVYEVWLSADTLSSSQQIALPGKHAYDVVVSPNPFKEHFSVQFDLPREASMQYFVTNDLGQIVCASPKVSFAAGRHILDVATGDHAPGHFLLTLVFEDKYYVIKRLVRSAF